MKATGLRYVSRFLAVAALFAAALVTSSTAYAAEGDLKSALDDYAAGKFEDALTKLRAYCAANPGDDEVYRVLKTTDERVKLRALAAGGESEQLMRYLLEKARPVVEARKRDPERMKKLAEEALSERLEVRRRAGLELAISSGDNAVPYLLPALGGSDVEKATAAIFALHAIGAEAVLPLVAAMDSGDAALRGMVAAVLGDLRDRRAIPVLFRAVANDADETVKARAQAALAKIGVPASNAAPAARAVAAYIAVGNMYYSNDPSVMSSADETANSWRWEGEGLVRYEVSHALYSAHLAEASANAALAIDPACMDARSLLVRAVISQGLAGAMMGEKAPESLKGAWDLLCSQGYDAANAALSTALAQKDWDVAVEACQLIADTYSNQAMNGSPIGMALAASERRVQYAAAVAALRMSPNGPFENSGQVPALAAQAASETALRQVFVIDDHSAARGRVTQDLREAGFVVADESDGYRGVARLKSTPTVDVVVVRADLGEAGEIPLLRWRSTLAVIDELQADLRTKNMRIVVVAGGDSAEKLAEKKAFLSAKYGEKIAGFIEEPLATASVKDAVEAAAAKGEMTKYQGAAIKLAADAADAFATTNAHCTAWDFKVAIDPLANNAQEGASDAVKMNSIRALANLRAGGSAGLAAVLKSADAKEELKVAAAGALGRVLGVVAPTGDEVDALIAAAKGGGVVGSAAMRALGMVKGLTADQARAAYAAHRMEVGKKSE